MSWLLVLFLFFGLAGGSDSTFTVPLPAFTPLVAAPSGAGWAGATFQVSSPVVILCKLQDQACSTRVLLALLLKREKHSLKL
jgi:hypothetical protein